MPSSSHASNPLAALIEQAKAEAERIGPAGAEVVRHLEAAASAARSASGDGRPDEGLRPEELTTANDK